MKYFLRTCLACIFMLAFTHAKAILPPSAPVISEMYVYNGGGSMPISPTNVPINTPIYIRFDQTTYTSGPTGTSFVPGTNVASLLTFSGGITFTATIDGTAGGQFITVIPTPSPQQLFSNTTYTITLNAGGFKDVTGLPNVALSVSFTTAGSVAITAPTIDLCNNGTYATFPNIVISEISTAGFGEGTNQVFEIDAPTGFEFLAGSGNIATTVGDITGMSMFVSVTKLTLLYSVSSNYFANDVITISNLTIKRTTATAGADLLRTGGNAAQTGNRPYPSSSRVHGTINLITTPTAPAVSTITTTNLCAGFALGTSIGNITLSAGQILTFYDALSNTVIGTKNTSGIIFPTDLGYTIANNNIVGTKNFLMSIRSTAAPFCESAKIPFSITNNPAPFASIVGGTSNICTPDQTIFSAVGTVGATFDFYLKVNSGAFTLLTFPNILYVTRSGDDITTKTTIPAGNYQLYAVASFGGCLSSPSNIANFVVNTGPGTVAFPWSSGTNYSSNAGVVSLNNGTTDGGTVGGVFNTVGGVYSGPSVAGTNFNPNTIPSALFNTPLVITYSYTLNGCTRSDNIIFTVFNGTNPINNLNNIYCADAPISSILTPKNGSPIPTNALAPGPVFFSVTPFPDNTFFQFPTNLGGNQGIVHTPGVGYTFNPALITASMYPVGSDFVDIQIYMVRWILITTFPINQYYPFTEYTTVRVYKKPTISINLIPNENFCSTGSPRTLLPLVSATTPPVGSTINIEYRVLPSGTFAILPSNTIDPTLLVAGNYQMKYSYLSPQMCTQSIIVPFTVSDAPTPVMSIRNTVNAIITTACINDGSINLNRTVSTYAGTYTISTVGFPDVIVSISLGANSVNVPFNSLNGVGVYSVILTVSNAGCSSSSVVNSITIYDNPVPTFTFSGASSLGICIDANSFVVSPNIGALPPGSGRVFIQKTVGAVGQLFPIGIINFNPLTDFNTNTGTGVGTYNIRYEYTSNAGSCKGISSFSQLTINPLPIVNFTLSTTNICDNLIRDLITVSPTLTSGTFVPATGIVKIYDTMVSTTVLQQYNGTYIINTTGLTVNPTIVNTFFVEVTFTDVNGCIGISPRKSFNINPLPFATVSFAVDNQFCADESAGTPFVNLIYSGLTAFNLANSSFTISNGVSSTIIPALQGINNFNPSAMGAGNYTITHTYTYANGCTKTTTPQSFDINALPQPAFTFGTASGPTNDEICADQTNVLLFPSIANSSAFGVGSFVAANGTFTITKGGVPIPAVITANSFNPTSSAFSSSIGGISGTYDITYTYVIPGRCSNSITQTLIINALPSVSFTFDAGTVNEVNVAGNARVCGNFVVITLVPSISGVAGASFYYSIQETGIPSPPLPIIINSNTILPTDIGILAITPLTTIRNFDIKFVYTDANGCTGISLIKTLQVVPIPSPIFTEGTTRCVNQLVSFDATASVIQGTDIVAPNGYVWDFGDGTGPIVSPLNNPIIQHTFVNAQNYTVSLTITTVLGCSKTFSKIINVGSIPVANFTTSAFCQGATTSFVSTSTVNNGTLTNYAWDFRDGVTSLINLTSTTTHVYTAPGRYIAKLTITTDTRCIDIKEREVFIFPRITPTATAPYKDNFDGADNNTWFATGQIKATLNPLQDTTGTSWRRGIPNGAKIKATTTAGGAWFTGGNNNTYYPNERSYVESPCFNFTSLTKPMISMKIWYDTDRGSDAGALYASTDDGAIWMVVGTINEGIEWYNTAGIISQPAGQNVPNAWTGDTLTSFKIAKFNLDQFKGLPSVRFRVGFGSNADNPVGRTFDGFAFDEVFIGDRNRIALLEHFTNAASSEANTENTFINNFPSVAAQTEIYNIQYHTNFPGNDPMNNDNTADPSARALFYGVSQTPRTAIDGVIENRKFSEWGTPVYNKRTLENAPFEISVSFPTIPRELLNITATVKALEPFARRVIVQTVVIEQEILGTAFTNGNFGGLTFKNVVKKMIPNAAGSRIDKTWLAGTQEVLNLNWSPFKVYNGNKLVVVVFVQDDITKEIYQAAFFNVTTNPTGTDPTTALDPQTQAQTLDNEFVVYPNPAQNEVFTGFRNEITEDFSVVLFDSYGKKLDVFSLTKGNKGLLLNTEKYASGMYFVEITGKNNIKARRKLVIAR